VRSERQHVGKGTAEKRATKQNTSIHSKKAPGSDAAAARRRGGPRALTGGGACSSSSSKNSSPFPPHPPVSTLSNPETLRILAEASKVHPTLNLSLFWGFNFLEERERERERKVEKKTRANERARIEKGHTPLPFDAASLQVLPAQLPPAPAALDVDQIVTPRGQRDVVLDRWGIVDVHGPTR